MPLLESININPIDLQEILNQLAAKDYHGQVTIIDCKFSWTVRDSNQFLLADVKKTE